jgi:HD domain-containing protein
MESMRMSEDQAGALGELRVRTIDAMKGVFGDDTGRIEHAMQVLGFAEEILAREPGDAEVVVPAAILHDIGIPESERKHNSAAAKYQEIEGPPIAREILSQLGCAEAIVEHICRIIANHHSARDIDTPEFRIIWDADWLVNLRHEATQCPRRRLEERIDRIFKTPTGRTLARSRYLDHSPD